MLAVHIAFGPDEKKSSRHPCFKLSSGEALLKLRQRVWEHYERGGNAAPQVCIDCCECIACS